MAGSAKRERQLARERYLRQQERRAKARAKRRRMQQVTAVVVAVVVIIGGIAALATLVGGNGKTEAAGKPRTASTPPSVPPSEPAGATGDCVYTRNGAESAKHVEPPTYDKSKAATYRKPFTATLTTNMGDIVIAMDAAKAPCTTNNFRHLAESQFYDLSACHRLTTQIIYVLQCGDPTGTGQGGPGYGFGVENPPADGKYPAGTVAMARTADPNSNGSQFFLVYKETSLPDANGYSIFGHITKGLDIVQSVAAAGTTDPKGDGPPKKKVIIESVSIGPA